jgi:hypothetical protein
MTFTSIATKDTDSRGQRVEGVSSRSILCSVADVIDTGWRTSRVAKSCNGLVFNTGHIWNRFEDESKRFTVMACG